MDVEIVKKDGSKYRLSDYGVVYDFVVGSIAMEHYDDRVEGRSGKLDYGADYSSRRIIVPMKFKHQTMHDYAHLRDELYGILTDVESYYIREMRRPKRLEYEFVDFGTAPRNKPQTSNRYVNGKQYLVRMVSELEPEQLYNGGEIEIEFETTFLPFAETIYSTKYLNDATFAEYRNMFGLTDNINQDMTSYTFTENNFSVWNGGNVTVAPESMYLSIRLSNVNSTGNAKITNTTTGESFLYKDALTNDTIVLSGAQCLISNANRLRNSNRNFVSIAPGVNRFSITNMSFKDITIDFKYYYK